MLNGQKLGIKSLKWYNLKLKKYFLQNKHEKKLSAGFIIYFYWINKVFDESILVLYYVL